MPVTADILADILSVDHFCKLRESYDECHRLLANVRLILGNKSAKPPTLSERAKTKKNGMAEGHNWDSVNNIILTSYTWTADKIIQSINRAHRLTSRRDVNLYVISFAIRAPTVCWRTTSTRRCVRANWPLTDGCWVKPAMSAASPSCSATP